ncbi:MAG: hypothetical protein ACOC8E_08690, partial [Planctomycetota bacterium]
VKLLTLGRHFRLTGPCTIVVGRDQDENGRLEKLARDGDTLLELFGIPGPLTLVRGAPAPADIKLAAGVTARYSKARDRDRVAVRAFDNDRNTVADLEVAPVTNDVCRPLMIRPDK